MRSSSPVCLPPLRTAVLIQDFNDGLSRPCGGKDTSKPLLSPLFCLRAGGQLHPLCSHDQSAPDLHDFPACLHLSQHLPPGCCTPWLLQTGKFPLVGTVSVMRVILPSSTGPNKHGVNENGAQITDKTQLLHLYRQDDWLRGALISLTCVYS